MSKITSSDGTMFVTFGKNKNGTVSATLRMNSFTDDEGNFYPAIGCEKWDSFKSYDEAKQWAEFRMEDCDV